MYCLRCLNTNDFFRKNPQLVKAKTIRTIHNNGAIIRVYRCNHRDSETLQGRLKFTNSGCGYTFETIERFTNCYYDKVINKFVSENTNLLKDFCCPYCYYEKNEMYKLTLVQKWQYNEFLRINQKRCNFCDRLFFTYESVVNKDNFLNLIQYCKLEKYPNKKNKFRFLIG